MNLSYMRMARWDDWNCLLRFLSQFEVWVGEEDRPRRLDTLSETTRVPEIRTQYFL